MLSDKGMRVLRKQELDAFLAQAVSPQLMDAQGIQLMQVRLLACPSVQPSDCKFKQDMVFLCSSLW